MRVRRRELEHQNMSLKERLLVARNQLMAGTGPNKNKRYFYEKPRFETLKLKKITQSIKFT